MELAEKSIRIPVRAPDCFLLAMDAFMLRTGQGSHNCQSVLELSGPPDLEKLNAAAAHFTERHPLLFATLRRNWRTWLPFWESPPASKRPPLPVGIWEESDKIPDGASFLQSFLNQPLDPQGLPFNARLDLLTRLDGTALLAFTWSHRIMDGKGAELLLSDLGQICEGVDEVCGLPQGETDFAPWQELVRRTKPLMNRFDELAALGVHSLGGPKPRKGTCRFEVITFGPDESEQIRTRAAEITGALFPLPFYLACATRAHAAVFALRGKVPQSYVSAVPIQTRRRGSRGPLFHNQVSIFFFNCLHTDTSTLNKAALALKKQFAEMTREKLNESFNAVLELMMRVPSFLFIKIVRRQFRGEINTFFFSHTGAFAPDLLTIAGAKIENAWHLPSLGIPPGTGIFFSERNDQLTATLSWRENSITLEERDSMIHLLRNDLLGTKNPANVSHAL